MTKPTSSIGERVAAYRRRRGLSQTVLAGLIGRSESWVSQVERGLRSVDKMSVILDLAQALNVTPDQLIGTRPWVLAPNGQHTADGLSEVRTFFTRHDDLLGEYPGTIDLPTLRTQVATVHRNYQAARYETVLHTLPDLLANADVAYRQGDRAGDEEIGLGYVSAYVAAAKLLTKLGAADLSLIAADRAANAALDAGSDVARAMAAYQVVCALQRSNQGDDAEHLAVTMAEQLEPSTRSDQPTLVSVTGALWLIAAVVAARRTDRENAWDRLDRADQLAQLLGEDANHAWTAFGPTNVQLHRVSVAVELGDAAEAVRLAAHLDVNHFPPGLTSRRAQVQLDLAWAQAQRRRDAEATLHLLEAERTAPETVRYNAIVHELIRDMLTRATRGQTTALHDLATRAAVLA